MKKIVPPRCSIFLNGREYRAGDEYEITENIKASKKDTKKQEITDVKSIDPS